MPVNITKPAASPVKLRRRAFDIEGTATAGTVAQVRVVLISEGVADRVCGPVPVDSVSGEWSVRVGQVQPDDYTIRAFGERAGPIFNPLDVDTKHGIKCRDKP